MSIRQVISQMSMWYMDEGYCAVEQLCWKTLQARRRHCERQWKLLDEAVPMVEGVRELGRAKA